MTSIKPSSNTSNLAMTEIDLADTLHSQALIRLLSSYAEDEMGGGTPLENHVQHNLVPALACRTDYLGLLAAVDGKYIGLLNAFEGFSTFYARPLLNIHDVFVEPVYRGHRIAGSLMLAAERIAQGRDYCKLTLEVLKENRAAQTAYQRAGFQPYELGNKNGRAEFWEKVLDN